MIFAIPNMGPSESEFFRIRMPPDEDARYQSKLGPIQPGLDSFSDQCRSSTAMITTQHLVHIHYKNEWKWAQTMEVLEEGKLVIMRFEEGNTFKMKTEDQDTTTGYQTLREAIQRTFPTLVRLSQLTEPDRIYGTENREKGKRKIGWAQAIYPLQARLQELKTIHLSPEKWDDTFEQINRTQKQRADLYGYPTKTDRSRVHNTRLNPSHPERERDQVLLPRSKRSR